jgi:PHD/YefM family antitoxin component YafN of YafNO toxin-antitoxin module
MEAIYPITSLQKNVQEVRESAKSNIVHITENGKAAYIFCSEEVLDELISKERDDAAYESYLLAAVREGAEDIEAGRFVTSRGEMFSEAAKRRANHG